MSLVARNRLQKGVKLLFIVGVLFIFYIFTDFSFNLPTPTSYQFRLPELELNQPVLLKQGSVMVVIVRYDPETVVNYGAATSGNLLVDARDDQPSVAQEYYVAMGYGTVSGCPLEISTGMYRESCSDARYDLLGRALKKQHYPDLKIPQYTFNHDFSLLTIE